MKNKLMMITVVLGVILIGLFVRNWVNEAIDSTKLSMQVGAYHD